MTSVAPDEFAIAVIDGGNSQGIEDESGNRLAKERLRKIGYKIWAALMSPSGMVEIPRLQAQ